MFRVGASRLSSHLFRCAGSASTQGLAPATRGSLASAAADDWHGAGFSAGGIMQPGTRSTTVLCVRKEGKVVMVADGQVTMGSEVIKPNVTKVRKVGDGVIGGFAGATADAFTLFERLEQRLDEHPGQLMRAAVELAKAWRMDKFLRKLDATMIVADKDISLQITGNGDVLEPHDGIIAIGSGGSYALAAARALIDVDGYDAEKITMKSMNIAADACIYTNHNFKVLSLDDKEAGGAEEGGEKGKEGK